MVNIKKLIAVIIAAICGIAVFVMADSFFSGAFLAMLLILLIMSALIVLFSGRKLDLTASGAQYGHRDEPSSFIISARNRSAVPVVDTKISFKVKNLLTEEEEIYPVSLACGPRAESGEHIPAPSGHSGCIELSVEDAGVKDPFGIFGKKINSDLSSRYFVMPKEGIMELEENQISTYDMESYKYSEDRGGTDTSETFDIREYAPGDSIKAIHWKLSAKADDIVIREPSHPIENKIILILDKCRKLPPDETDKYVDLLASISEGLLRKGIVHSIGWYDAVKHKFIVKTISDQQEKWDTIMEMMTSPFRDEEVSTPYRLVEAGIEDTWSSYIYISPDERDMERLAEYGEVSIARP